MADSIANYNRISVQELKGVDERSQHANPDMGFFDVLRGCVPLNKGTVTKANGCKLCLNFGERVLGIFQTNDSRRNIIVQTQSAIRIVTEEELFGQPAIPTNLIPIATNEEETMSRVTICHQVAAAVKGGTYTTANVWQQAPLSSIVNQTNPDGTAAAFASLAANQITLAAGIYRIQGYSIMSNATVNTKIAARLYNITAGQPAWNGAANEVSYGTLVVANNNERVDIDGDLNLAVPTILEIQGLQSVAQANSGFGFGLSAAGFSTSKELFRWLSILKTA